MNMKDHILAALREQFETWQDLLDGLDQTRLTAPLGSSGWSPKDVMAHLMAWQQRSNARLETAQTGQEPVLPTWNPQVDPEATGSLDVTNAWLYEHYRDWNWPRVYRAWREGFDRFLALGEGITEVDLLDFGRYPWLEGYPMVVVLTASYNHHQEHLDHVMASL